jgi:hypothetical protein
MKFWAKLVACFLIAWLPLAGYPASGALCPEMSAIAQHQHASTSRASDPMAACAHEERHGVINAQHACAGGTGGFVCGVPAIPVTYSVIVTPSAPVYRAIAPTFAEQFIPELPAPPPRSL